MFPLHSRSNSPWSDNAYYKSAKRDLFPKSEGNCGANIISNQYANPVMCVPNGSLVFSINLSSDNET